MVHPTAVQDILRLQVTLQSLFIADITCRSTYLPQHDRTKPGRQAVTFLLIANMTLWIVYTFEMQKVEASPVQLGFYGFFAWTFIIRSSLPLSIFYRQENYVQIFQRPRVEVVVFCLALALHTRTYKHNRYLCLSTSGSTHQSLQRRFGKTHTEMLSTERSVEVHSSRKRDMLPLRAL